MLFCLYCFSCPDHWIVWIGDAQKVAINVKSGYTPGLMVVKAGSPVRLRFDRQESAACSEKVLLPDFDKSALLLEGQDVTLEFTP